MTTNLGSDRFVPRQDRCGVGAPAERAKQCEDVRRLVLAVRPVVTQLVLTPLTLALWLSYSLRDSSRMVDGR